MTRTVGMVTIGQAPRVDVVPEMAKLMGSAEIIERGALDGLTPREIEVLAAIAAGLSNAELAARFRISGATVKSHINHLLAKTGSRDRGQLVGYAFRHGLAA